MEPVSGHQQQTPLIAAPNEMLDQAAKFDFWGMLSRRKWIVFILFVAGLSAAAVYYYQAETIYESTAKVAIEPKNRLAINLARSQGFENALEAAQTSHGDRIDSPTFIKKCFDSRLHLYELETFKDMSQNDIIYEVEAKLEVEVDREDQDIYYLTFSCKNEDDAATVLNNLIDAYEDELETKHKLEIDKVITAFEKIRDTLQTEYDGRLNDLRKSQAKFDAVPVNSTNGQTYEEMVLAQLQTHITTVDKALKSEVNKRDRVEAMKAEGEDSAKIIVWLLIQNREILKTIGNEEAGTLNTSRERSLTIQRLEQLKMQREIGKHRFGPNHPTMIELDQQIAFWTEYLETGTVGEDQADENFGADFVSPEEMVRRYELDLNTNIVQLQQEQSDVQEKLNVALERALHLKKVKEEIDMRQQQLEKTEIFLNEAEKIVKQFEQDNQNKEAKGYYFDVLFPAKPGSPIWPHLPIVFSLGGLLGAVLGLGMAYLVDMADKTFRSPDEITRQLGLPLIGHIPVISTSKRFKLEDSLIDPVVCSFHRPKSQSAEAFRAIRTALFFNTQGKAHSVIQVTSPTPGDGKSTVACNVAVSIAQSGKRVLIVDGDMRRPTMHHLFGIKSNEGFASVLAGDSRWEDCIFECEEIEGLSVMPCGTKPSNPAELITSPRVKQLINEMRQKYDFVVIDTPPLLAVTDPCPVAARVDGVILTLRIKKNVKISAERASEILHGLGAGIVGVVVNGVGVQTGYGSQYSYGAYRAGYSYNGYGYGYGYGYGGKYYDEERHAAGRQTRPPRRIEGPANGAIVPPGTGETSVNRE